MSLPRIRSAAQAAAELRKMDPDTVFRECHIRALMNSGAVTVIRAGRRQFVNLDQLIECLNTPGLVDLHPKATGTVRAVPEGLKR
ncbi:MAG: hypothetical protein KH050_08665 [Clostridiaceae bacterium]|nr:hypothetical protein [Clostridiaceae bacterium]